MTQRKSLARKLIVLFIVLVILIPCSVLVYDTVVSSNEERVDFYYMMSDGSMGALKKNIPRTDKEAMLKNVLAILQEGPNADGATASMPQNLEIRSVTLEQATVTVDFSDASSNTVPASIYKIVQYNNSDKALVILQCTYMDTTLSEIRQEPVEIGMGSYSGLRVSKKAIHDDYVEKTTYDDKGNEHKESKKVQGVYVLYGSEVQFKEISIVYAGNDYVLCDSSPTDGTLFSGETISLYDQIITEGDDLYDGKVIK